MPKPTTKKVPSASVSEKAAYAFVMYLMFMGQFGRASAEGCKMGPPNFIAHPLTYQEALEGIALIFKHCHMTADIKNITVIGQREKEYNFERMNCSFYNMVTPRGPAISERCEFSYKDQHGKTKTITRTPPHYEDLRQMNNNPRAYRR